VKNPVNDVGQGYAVLPGQVANAASAVMSFGCGDEIPYPFDAEAACASSPRMCNQLIRARRSARVIALDEGIRMGTGTFRLRKSRDNLRERGGDAGPGS
jgi:hypothetical protein